MKDKLKHKQATLGTPINKTPKDKLIPVGDRPRMTAGIEGYDLEGQLTLKDYYQSE